MTRGSLKQSYETQHVDAFRVVFCRVRQVSRHLWHRCSLSTARFCSDVFRQFRRAIGGLASPEHMDRLMAPARRASELDLCRHRRALRRGVSGATSPRVTVPHTCVGYGPSRPLPFRADICRARARSVGSSSVDRSAACGPLRASLQQERPPQRWGSLEDGRGRSMAVAGAVVSRAGSHSCQTEHVLHGVWAGMRRSMQSLRGSGKMPSTLRLHRAAPDPRGMLDEQAHERVRRRVQEATAEPLALGDGLWLSVRRARHHLLPCSEERRLRVWTCVVCVCVCVCVLHCCVRRQARPHSQTGFLAAAPVALPSTCPTRVREVAALHVVGKIDVQASPRAIRAPVDERGRFPRIGPRCVLGALLFRFSGIPHLPSGRRSPQLHTRMAHNEVFEICTQEPLIW